MLLALVVMHVRLKDSKASRACCSFTHCFMTLSQQSFNSPQWLRVLHSIWLETSVLDNSLNNRIALVVYSLYLLCLVHESTIDLFFLFFIFFECADFFFTNLSSQNVGVVVDKVLEDGFHGLDPVVEELLPILGLPHLHVVAHEVILDQVRHRALLPLHRSYPLRTRRHRLLLGVAQQLAGELG